MVTGEVMGNCSLNCKTEELKAAVQTTGRNKVGTISSKIWSLVPLGDWVKTANLSLEIGILAQIDVWILKHLYKSCLKLYWIVVMCLCEIHDKVVHD